MLFICTAKCRGKELNFRHPALKVLVQLEERELLQTAFSSLLSMRGCDLDTEGPAAGDC